MEGFNLSIKEEPSIKNIEFNCSDHKHSSNLEQTICEKTDINAALEVPSKTMEPLTHSEASLIPCEIEHNNIDHSNVSMLMVPGIFEIAESNNTAHNVVEASVPIKMTELVDSSNSSNDFSQGSLTTRKAADSESSSLDLNYVSKNSLSNHESKELTAAANSIDSSYNEADKLINAPCKLKNLDLSCYSDEIFPVIDNTYLQHQTGDQNGTCSKEETMGDQNATCSKEETLLSNAPANDFTKDNVVIVAIDKQPIAEEAMASDDDELRVSPVGEIVILDVTETNVYRQAPIIINDSSDEDSSQWTSDSEPDSEDETGRAQPNKISASSSDLTSSEDDEPVQVQNKKQTEPSRKLKNKQ